MKKHKRPTEDGIHDTEALLRGVVDCLEDAVFVHDAKTGRVIYVNRRMLDMYGCEDLEEAVRKGPKVFSLGKHPYSEDDVAKHIKDVMEHGPKRFQWRARHKDGTLFWTEVSLSPLEIRGKWFVIAIVKDISPRVSQELQLEDVRNRYWALLDNVNKGVVVYQSVERDGELDFIISDMNRIAAELEGVELSDVVGKSVVEVFPGVVEFGLYKVFEQVYRTGAPQHFPVAFYKDSEREGWRENVVYRLPSGEIVAVYEDRSREKEIEHALQKSEHVLKAIFDAVPAAICLVDMDKRVFKWISPYIENITGFSAAELTGRTPRVLYATEEEYRRIGRAYGLFAKNDLVDLETEFRHRDGRMVAIQLKAVKLGNDVLCAIFDITERKKAEEEKMEMGRHLLRVQQLESLGVLAGGIAHDFNNLLMGIQGNAELLSMLLAGNADIEKYTGAIKRATEKAAALCRHMLTYAGKGKITSESINLSVFIKGLKDIISISVSKNVNIDFDLNDSIPDILADPDQMRQMIMNLLINASEAIGESSGIIRVTTGVTRCPPSFSAGMLENGHKGRAECVYLVVRDNGCGMDETVKQRIFDPFFTTKFAGRGLGMAAVHGIVSSHGGSIEIQSEPGHGTTVCIFLPVEPTELNLSGLPTEAMKLPTILVVDDEAYVREVAEEMLKMGGYNVITAASGKDAVDIYNRYMSEIGCIILDYTMPEIGGKETFERLKMANPEAKIIISSGHDSVDIMSGFRAGDVAGFLPKPYHYGQLHKIVGEALKDG